MTINLTDVVFLSSDTEIKGDILFLGYYESEFDWSNETAKVKLPQCCGYSCFSSLLILILCFLVYI